MYFLNVNLSPFEQYFFCHVQVKSHHLLPFLHFTIHKYYLFCFITVIFLYRLGTSKNTTKFLALKRTVPVMLGPLLPIYQCL